MRLILYCVMTMLSTQSVLGLVSTKTQVLVLDHLCKTAVWVHPL